ncbi:MAG: tetratricopeptide repeat protein [Magnetococcales bacterium]|nr:tetratricopeptide repeat protein [Magnetococcales bacterium]
MQILAFFSFKGGVGRTALLTNLAAYWASVGQVVGLVDMDLAAPGLSFSPLLSPTPLDPEMQGRGFSDLLAAYYFGRDEDDRLGYFPPAGLFYEMRAPQAQWGNGGVILVMPAGNVHFRYPPATTIEVAFPGKKGRTPVESPDDRALRAFASLLKRDMRAFRLPSGHPQAGRGLDYLLIDCRTGFPELLDLVLGYLADRMVLVSGLNGQNLVGLDLTLGKLRAERVPEGYFARDVVVVFSPVPVHIHDDPESLAVLEQGRNIVHAHRKPPRNNMQQEDGPKIFTLPYTPRLAVSDLPLTTVSLDHPYSRSVVEIADFLQETPVDSQIEQVKDKLVRAGAATLSIGKQGAGTDQESIWKGYATPVERSDCHAIMQLPKWYWPLTQSGKCTPEVSQRLHQLKNGRSDLRSEVLESFLDGLSGSIALSRQEKQAMLSSLSQRSTTQIQQLTDVFNEERQKLSSLPDHQQNDLHQQLYKHQMEWADLLVTPAGEGMRRFLLWPLEGISLFSAWESHPDYWWRLAQDLKGELGQKTRAWEAMARAQKLESIPQNALDELLNRMDPRDPAWNRQIVEQAKVLAGEDPWMQFQIVRKESAPEAGQIEAIMHLLMQQLSQLDGRRCFILAAWILDHQPRLGASTEPFLRRAVEQLPDDSYVMNSWGNLLCHHLKRYEEAEAAYRKAMALDDKNAHVLGNFALFMQNVRQDYDLAEELYRRALQADPNHANHLGNFAVFMENVRQDHDQAEELYRRALQADPNHANHLGNFALFMQNVRQDYDLAEELYRRAIQADPNHANHLGNFALFMQNVRQDYDQAEKLYRRAIQADPNHANNLGNFALFMQNIRQDYDQAEELYHRAIQADPNDANLPSRTNP